MPRYATCNKSSNGSPRLAKRRAKCIASDLCASISSLRNRRSCVPRYSTNFLRSASRSSADKAMSVRQSLHAPKTRFAVLGVDAVFVDDSREDLAGEIIDGRCLGAVETGATLDLDATFDRRERQFQLLVARGVDEDAREFVDRDPQVFDLIDVEADPARNPRRCESRDTHELECGGDREADCFRHCDPRGRAPPARELRHVFLRYDRTGRASSCPRRVGPRYPLCDLAKRVPAPVPGYTIMRREHLWGTTVRSSAG